MRLSLLLILFVNTTFIFFGSCSHKQGESAIGNNRAEKGRTLSESAIISIDRKEVQSQLTIEATRFQKLQAKYKAKGFESFCTLKADIDSIFLVSTYMANVIYGEDNAAAAKTSLAEWIEKDKLDAYYRSRKLNSKEVNQDLADFAVNPFCNEYLELRHQAVQDEINNVIYSRLTKEAHEKYTP